MDHAIQKAVKEAVKDFDHTNDYYFLIFDHLTKNFNVSSSSSSSSALVPPQSSSSLSTSSSPSDGIVDGETTTETDSSDKEYVDYLLFDSGDGVIVRIERRSPSPSTLKIKNCNDIVDNTNKLFNYDLNSKISSSACWDDDIILNDDFSDMSAIKKSTVNNSTTINQSITTNIAETSTGSTEINMKKMNKSSLSEPLTDKSNNYNNNQNNSMKRLPSDNDVFRNSLSSLDSWTMVTDSSTSTMNTKEILNNHRNDNDNIINNSKVQHEMNEQNQLCQQNKQQILRNNLNNGGNRNIGNNSNSINSNNNNNNGIIGSGNGDSDDDNIIFDSNSEKPWICKNCNRGYKWRNSLTCHQKNECGKPPKYYCTKLCGYRTNIRSNLRRHLNTKCNKNKILTSSSLSSNTSQSSTISSSKGITTAKNVLTPTLSTSLSSASQQLLQTSTKLSSNHNSSLNVFYSKTTGKTTKNSYSTGNRNAPRNNDSRLLNKTIS